jgi:hypothetical protein
MGKCEMCGKEIDDKYKFCMGCVQQMKKDNAEVGATSSGSNADVVKSLGALNNNLYAIRTLLETQLEIQYGFLLVWDKETAKFVIQKTKQKKKVKK